VCVYDEGRHIFMCVMKDMYVYVYDERCVCLCMIKGDMCACVMKGDACVNVCGRETHMYVCGERSVRVCV